MVESTSIMALLLHTHPVIGKLQIWLLGKLIFLTIEVYEANLKLP